MRGLAGGFVVAMLAGSAVSDEGVPMRGVLTEQNSAVLKYLEYVPEAYNEQDQWPLVLFLHGAGERGDDLNRVRSHGPPKEIDAGASYPFILIAPQAPLETWWQPEDLVMLLDEVSANYQIDPRRVYLTGLSMGGFGTWALAAHSPGRFAALLPICGGGEAATAASIASIPTWVLHGAKDEVVPLARSQAMVDALLDAGADPRFTVYPDAGHDSWSETYANPDVYEWLLGQVRD